MPFSYFPPLGEQVWGNLDGDIERQDDLIDLIDEKTGEAEQKQNLLINSNFSVWQRVATKLEVKSRERTSNLVTLETEVPHGYRTGDMVQITNMGAGTYDEPSGTVIAKIDDTHFSYTNTGGDESNTTELSGTCLLLDRISMVCGDGDFFADRWFALNESSEPIATEDEGAKLTATASGKLGVMQIVPHRYLEQYLDSGLSLSIDVKSESATKVKLALLTWEGNADEPNHDVVDSWNGVGANPSLVTDWGYESISNEVELSSEFQTLKLEDISVSTSANNIAIFLWIEGLSADENILINNAQIIEGSSYITYKRGYYVDEVIKCLQFYKKSYSLADPPYKKTDEGKVSFASSYGISNGNVVGTVHYCDMYKTPSVELISSADPPVNDYWVVSTGVNVGMAVDYENAKSFTVINDSGFSISTSSVGGHYVLDAEI